MKTISADLLFSPGSAELRFLPEGPTDLGGGEFSWVAIQHGPANRFGSLNIFRLADRSNRNFLLPGRPGFAKPTDIDGHFVVGCERQLGVFDIVSGRWRAFCDGIDLDVDNTIINDGYTFGDNIVFGTKDLEFRTKKAGLYLFRGRDQKLIRLRADQVCSNGKAVIRSMSGDLQLLDIDSPTRRLVRYCLDVDAGQISDERTVADFSQMTAVPDGLTLTPDQQSAIISFYNPTAAPQGQTIQIRLSDGQPECLWETPGSPQATCPALVRANDGSIKLVITTAVEHMPPERQLQARQAGCLFIADTQFTELSPPTKFPLTTELLMNGHSAP